MKKKMKQISAIIAVLCLLALYAATFFFAISDSENAGSMFQACLVSTVAVPILLWIWLGIYDAVTGKNHHASLYQREADRADSNEADTQE